ncbi:S8 family peptidase [Hymenobacter sp. BT491]|uniref:S8 family peptidase n=1 Tax=Hymenobacter sp. BT491 TaxID=2766779 RepID=UPI001653B865|nr:S8 family serine peptidase [Hymenobacter sp. BT491]MBC6992484.1 S8 family serine peptidase [Hymenobacter sp. BT491]
MDFKYIVAGKVISLPVNPQKIAVQFKEPSTHELRRASIGEKSEIGEFENRIEIPGEKITVVDVPQPKPQLENKALASAHYALNADSTVEKTVPVFKLGSSQVVPSDRILIGFHPQTNASAKNIIADINGKVLREDNNEYLIQLPATADPLDTVTRLAKLAEISYAEPDFITIGKHTPLKPVREEGETNGTESFSRCKRSKEELTADNAVGKTQEPLAVKQYALAITQTLAAKELISPNKDISIAILDEGVDLRHPDLANSIIGTYDATEDDSDQSPMPWDAHGTACAGLAAAVPSNEVGMQGVAGGCSLMAVRLAYSSTKGGNWITTPSAIKAAIKWAWQQGADVLSNSWGGGAPSTAVINEFENARTQGRNGKGCIIVIAAGNSSGPVDFPGDQPNVLTVSASNEYDEPKTKTSQDGEYWWGSNFGPEVDIAAPGVHNYTVDMVGIDGYNEANDIHGNYTDFNGTSSATPIVAGVAALVLSANPNLSEAQVREIIINTAEKAGKVVYKNGHNNQMGYGRINALKAVNAALNNNIV